MSPETLQERYQYYRQRLKRAQAKFPDATLSDLNYAWERAAWAEKFLHEHQEALQEQREKWDRPVRLSPLIKEVRQKAGKRLQQLEAEEPSVDDSLSYRPHQQNILAAVLKRIEHRGQERLRAGKHYQQEVHEMVELAEKDFPQRFWRRHLKKVDRELDFRKRVHKLRCQRADTLLLDSEGLLSGRPAELLAEFLQRLEAHRLEALLESWPEDRRQEIAQDPPAVLQRHMSGWQQRIQTLAADLVQALAELPPHQQVRALEESAPPNTSEKARSLEGLRQALTRKTELNLEFSSPEEDVHQTPAYQQWQEAGYGLGATLPATGTPDLTAGLPRLATATDELQDVLKQSYGTLEEFLNALTQIGEEEWAVAFGEEILASPEDAARSTSLSIQEARLQGHANFNLRRLEITPAIREALEKFARGNREPKQVQGFQIFLHEVFHGFSAWTSSEEAGHPERFAEEQAIEEGLVEWLSRRVVAQSVYEVESWDEVPEKLRETTQEGQQEADDPSLRPRQQQFIQNVYEEGGLEAVEKIWTPTTTRERLQQAGQVFASSRDAWQHHRKKILRERAHELQGQHTYLPEWSRVGTREEVWRGYHPAVGFEVSPPSREPRQAPDPKRPSRETAPRASTSPSRQPSSRSR